MLKPPSQVPNLASAVSANPPGSANPLGEILHREHGLMNSTALRIHCAQK